MQKTIKTTLSECKKLMDATICCLKVNIFENITKEIKIYMNYFVFIQITNGSYVI